MTEKTQRPGYSPEVRERAVRMVAEHVREYASQWACIKPMPTRTNIPPFSPFLYRFRNTAESYFNKLKHFRAIATRYEKHDANFLALVKLASVRIWLRTYESVS